MFWNKKEEIHDRFVEEELYLQVGEEIKNGIKKDGLWIKALTEAGGDENKARALYVKIRIQNIKDEEAVKTESFIEEKKKIEKKEFQKWKKQFDKIVINIVLIFILIIILLTVFSFSIDS